MLAALIFALGWASGAAVYRLGLGFLAAVALHNRISRALLFGLGIPQSLASTSVEY
jgi:hypothetical protein